MEVRVPIPARHKGLALPFAIQSSPAGTGTTTITSSRRVAADRITAGEAAPSPSPSRPDPPPAVRPLWVQWGAEIRSREAWSLLGVGKQPWLTFLDGFLPINPGFLFLPIRCWLGVFVLYGALLANPIRPSMARLGGSSSPAGEIDTGWH